MLLILTYISLTLCTYISGDTCPDGGIIYVRGMTEQGKKDILELHNAYRAKILNGQVSDQPRGVNLQPMVYDEELSLAAQSVSDTCKMAHILAKDDRFSWVGQNIYSTWSTKQKLDQNWTKPMVHWFEEHTEFIYPDIKINDGEVEHYTQVVWATSTHVGCDFIAFYDYTYERYPYCRMFTCNYGPGGNYVGRAPYQIP